jgi:hypothetical protein
MCYIENPGEGIQVEEISLVEDEGPFGDTPPESDLILLGILGIKDPLRPEVWCWFITEGVFFFLFFFLAGP